MRNSRLGLLMRRPPEFWRHDGIVPRLQGAANEVGVSQYQTGTIDFNRVFNLETTQVQQQDQLAIARGNIALNLISVYRALGGGWEIRLSDDAPRPRDVPPAAAASVPGPTSPLRPGR